jgi:WD40 repeat protein
MATSTPADERFRRLGPAATGQDNPRSIAVLHGQNALVVGCTNRRVRVLPLDGGKERSGAAGAPDLDALAVSPRGDRIVTGAGQCICMEASTLKKVWGTKADADLAGAAFAPDGKTVFVGLYNAGVAALDAESGKVMKRLGGTQGHVFAVAVSPDGKLLAAGDGSGNVVLTELPAFGTQRKEKSGLARAYCVAFGKENMMAVAGDGGEVRILSSQDLSVLRGLPTGNVRTTEPDSLRRWPSTRGLAFAPDGTTLVAATNPIGVNTAVLQVWNAETGEEKLHVEFPHGTVRRACVSDDGKTIGLAASTGVYVCPMP